MLQALQASLYFEEGRGRAEGPVVETSAVNGQSTLAMADEEDDEDDDDNDQDVSLLTNCLVYTVLYLYSWISKHDELFAYAN